MTRCRYRTSHKTKFVIGFTCIFSFIGAASATAVPNTSDPSTFLGPTLRFAFTNNIGNESAYSVAAEGGPRLGRVSGTLGWKIDDNQRFKVTAEYLWQQITYGFYSGNAEYWAQQGTAGVVYQYDLTNVAFFPQIGFNAYASHSPSKAFGNALGTFVNTQGIIQNFTNNRRATGGNAYGASPVLTLTPWHGGKIEGEVNYDSVGYDNDFPVNQNARGFGATANIHQLITPCINVGVGAAIRQPFNSYAANVTWSHVPYMKNWTVELFGEYTVGKYTLPDTYNVGMAADFYLDKRLQIDETPGPNGELITKPIVDNLLAWTAGPAVYMPVVLSVMDQNVAVS
jgi:hypothetical protein